MLTEKDRDMPETGRPEVVGEKIVASKEAVFCELEGEAVILSLRDGVYYGLNSVGLSIWELIQTPRTVEGVVESLMEQYDVNRERCESDTRSLIEALRTHQLVETANGTAGENPSA